MQRYFVTGTDTDAGKTLASAALLARARRLGLSTLGLKPVAAGCEREDGELSNADARLLGALTVPPLPYAMINPFALEPPIAPHLAIRQAGLALDLDVLESVVHATLDETSREVAVVEGAGGWRVPLNEREDLSGLAVRLRLPVILVVGLRLGCINHARLTLDAIRADGLHVAGWIGSRVEPTMREYHANLATLRQCLDAPCLGIVPWLGDAEDTGLTARAEAAAGYLRLPGERD
ncbi:MAG: dethiobiotin synthase [Halomonas sp.]|nr:dethiobiotin synthase [Halomonas sp.]